MNLTDMQEAAEFSLVCPTWVLVRSRGQCRPSCQQIGRGVYVGPSSMLLFLPRSLSRLRRRKPCIAASMVKSACKWHAPCGEHGPDMDDARQIIAAGRFSPLILAAKSGFSKTCCALLLVCLAWRPVMVVFPEGHITCGMHFLRALDKPCYVRVCCLTAEVSVYVPPQRPWKSYVDLADVKGPPVVHAPPGRLGST